MRRLVLLATVLCFTIPALAQAPTPEAKKIADVVDKRYNSVKTLKADFDSSYQGGGMRRNESGVLWLRRPGRMRWEYRSPREKLFLSDGKTAWFYVPGENQVRRAPVKKLDDLRSPLGFLLGRTNLDKQLANLTLARESASEPANLILKGVPKAMADRVAEVRLEVTPSGEIRRIVIEEVDGARTEFRFRNVEYNPVIQEAQFRFQPPAGAEIFETTDVAP